MDYTCYCGAKLRYVPDGNKWFCPQGHQVHTCKQCETMGKSTPLQWIEEYRRWYCYECKQYAVSPASTKTTEEIDKEKLRELVEDEEKEVEPRKYAMGFAQGSRVDEVCFGCRHLQFIENNALLKCGRNQLMFSEPAISSVTIRPQGCPKCRMGKLAWNMCGECSFLSGEPLANLQKWKEYIEKQVQEQILSHEKDAAPIEMYRVEFLDKNPAVEGALVTLYPIKRESILEGRVLVMIDKPSKRVWVYAGVKEPGRFFSGLLMGPAARLFGGYEDPLSSRYLRDLLKRDIESFAIERIYLGEESPEFWSAIDGGALQVAKSQVIHMEPKATFEGPKLEMYQIKFNLGRAQVEANTGGRSSSETKWITLDPLKTSIEEFDSKKMVLVIDHETKIVWLWIGQKSARIKTFIKARTTMTEAKREQLATIGSQIGKDVSDYDYIAAEERKEPQQFEQVLAQIKAT